MKKNVLKSAKTLLTVVACTSMLFTALSGCKNPIEDDTTRGGGRLPPAVLQLMDRVHPADHRVTRRFPLKRR